tara:strand:+ start:102 stop:371 length:270 start_codon:yes stop_codon:yes gene_type:complete
MHEPQYIYEKYFLTLLILLGLDNLGVKFIQLERKTLMGISVFYILITLYKNDLEKSFTFRVIFIFMDIFKLLISRVFYVAKIIAMNISR